MSTLRRVASSGLALLLAFQVTAAMPLFHAAHAHAQGEPVKIRVEITDQGFNEGGDLTIEVEQGQMVEITFVWNQQVNTLDEHDFVIDAYKLKSDKINSDHRETTLKFIADKVGTFDIKCDLDCLVHKLLQNGHLKVKPASGQGGSGAGQAGRTPTKLDLKRSAATGVAPTVLTAVLKDTTGAPVSKAEVVYFEDAEFVGTTGQMEIGIATTNDKGEATLTFRPTLNAATKVTARFEGVGLYAASEQAIDIGKADSAPSAYSPEPTGLENVPDEGFSAWSWSVNHWGPLTIASVVLAAWATFAYVLFEAHGVRRSRRSGGA